MPAAAISIVVALVPALHDAAAFSWFIGAGLGAAIYVPLGRRDVPTEPAVLLEPA